MTRIRYGARSLDEMRNREVEATSVKTWATTLVAIYETDPDVVRAVLPPIFSPLENPLVRVTIATVDVGRGYPVFGAGTVAVLCRHEDVEGDYALVMPMTTEQSVVGGRETFGEPKKLATIDLKVEGDLVNAWYERMGVRFLEIDGRIAGDLEPTPDRTRTSFYLKFLPAVGGKGFDSEPQLVDGRVVVITVGGGGIGHAMGRAFGEAGMKVVLADIQPEPLEKAVAELTADRLDVIGVPTDVTSYDSVCSLRDAVLSAYGAVNV